MKSKKGFTLIELLVVIAIIAMLLAILVPGLKMAKQKTQELVCRINLRGISLGMRLYIDDNDGRVYSKTITNRYMWYDINGNWLRPDNGNAYWGVAYKDYVDNVKAFGCPSFRRAESLYGSMPKELLLEAAFAINRNIASSRYPKVTDIKSPSQFIVCHDHQEPKIENGSEDHFHNNGPGSKNVRQYRYSLNGSRRDFYRNLFRHSMTSDDREKTGGKANILWLDGSSSPLEETTGDNVPRWWYEGR